MKFLGTWVNIIYFKAMKNIVLLFDIWVQINILFYFVWSTKAIAQLISRRNDKDVKNFLWDSSIFLLLNWLTLLFLRAFAF